MEKLQDRAAVVEKAIKELEKKILEIGGAKLLTQRSKVDGIKLHISLALDEITKAEVNKAKAEKDAAKAEKNIESNTTALEEVEAEVNELNEQLEETDALVTEMRTKVEAAQSAEENAKDDLENLKAELDVKTEQIQKFRQREVRCCVLQGQMPAYGVLIP